MKAHYEEDGGKWLVDIIKGQSNDKYEWYTLRCIEEIRPSPVFGHIHPGHQWDCDQLLSSKGLVFKLTLLQRAKS